MCVCVCSACRCRHDDACIRRRHVGWMHASSVSDCARAGAIAIDLVQGAVSFVRGAMAGTRMRRTCTHLVRNPAYCTVRCPCGRERVWSLHLAWSGVGARMRMGVSPSPPNCTVWSMSVVYVCRENGSIFKIKNRYATQSFDFPFGRASALDVHAFQKARREK